MKNLRNRALESAKAMEQSRWERLISSKGDFNTLQKKQREWEVACYILKAVENYEKEVNDNENV